MGTSSIDIYGSCLIGVFFFGLIGLSS